MSTDEHRRLRELLGAYALGQLHPDDEQVVRAHLDGCAACRAELATVAPLAGPLRLVDPDRLEAPAVNPPSGLEADILAAIQAQPRRIRSSAGSGRRRQYGRRVSRWLPVAAAFVVIGAVGGVVGYGVAPKPAQIPLEPVGISAAAAGINSTADVVAHTWGMEIKLNATGFEAGHRYRVVVVGRDGRLAPAGEFIGTGATRMRCNLNSSVRRSDVSQFRVLNERGASVVVANI